MKVLSRLSVLLLAIWCITMPALAQNNRTITGKVVDSKGQGVIAAGVIIDGTLRGTLTDDDGRFELLVPEGTVTLEVSCLGYLTQKVSVPAGQSILDIILPEGDMTLEETVVIGYGTQKKVNLTGAVTAVSGEDLSLRTAHNATLMLQGAVPGLNITTSSGNPGSTASINIRGVTSINDASPLILVDGAVGDIDRVNPNDIESISVIKDASAAAVYGARAAFGVILITTKQGRSRDDGKATVRFSARYGWEEPTTSTDYENRGYWSVYTTNLFWEPTKGSKYISYDANDMMQLLARVNDKTEHPDRPWVVEQTIGGKKQWKYYANTDYWHELFVDRHPVQQYNVSVTGGNKNVKYFLSGGYDNQTGIMKVNPDVFQKYNLRAKFDFRINKWATMSNNTSFYSSGYDFQGVGNVENVIAYGARHFLSNYTLKNPDGSWVYAVPYQSYRVGNGRHAIVGNNNNINKRDRTDFSNTTQLVIKPVDSFWITGNFTYRFRQNRNTSRTTNFAYRVNPDDELSYYTSGAGLNELTESVATYLYKAANVFATYDEEFGHHHLGATVGWNMETQYYKTFSASAENLISDYLNDLGLAAPDTTTGEIIDNVSGGQTEYALMGFFGRANYDYKGRYLFEVSARYDGTSRFAPGQRWGFFPSASVGWRISEEPFFSSIRNTVNNLKVRGSIGTLGNQNVANYIYIRSIKFSDLKHSFGGSSLPKYSYLTAPNASDLSWETAEQWNVGLDASAFNSRLQFTAETYVRNTKGMLTEGFALPAVYGADSPRMNTADLSTRGYELSLQWRNQIRVAGKPFGYGIRASMSDFSSVITKFDNPEKAFAKTYYEGQKLGDIWGFVCSGIFQTDEEARDWTTVVYDGEGNPVGGVDQSYMNTYLQNGVWSAGNLRFEDLDGDHKISTGENTANNPGDRKILGNSLPHLQYGITLDADYLGFDFSIFFQGTGNHYWYPTGGNFAFWGPYSLGYCSFLPKNFLDNVWSKDNPDAYFPKPGSNRASNSRGELGVVNSRYLQNIRYLRLKNLNFGYTIPQKLTHKFGLEKVRIYFSGENLEYWSPIKKNSAFVDPEAAIDRSDAYNNGFYPWQKSYMFGIDITF